MPVSLRLLPFANNLVGEKSELDTELIASVGLYAVGLVSGVLLMHAVRGRDLRAIHQCREELESELEAVHRSMLSRTRTQVISQ